MKRENSSALVVAEHGARLPKIPRRGNYTEQARLERLDFIRAQSGAALASVGQTTLNAEQLSSNMEAMIGSIEIPLGVAGPLLFHGEHVEGLVYAPIASTEGALVSSITRGAYAISVSGGITTRVMQQRMVRVPMFLLANMQEAQRFADFVAANLQRIQAVIRRYSNYAQLKELPVQLIGRAAHVHFVYETGDAAGQNMSTTCTWHACLWLVAQARQELGIAADQFIIEGGMSSDKKVSNANLIKGRGISVQAEARISKSVMRRVLKVEPELVQRYWHHSMAAAISSGMVGLNTNIANLVAAVFAATGQDLASVHESASGVISMDLLPNGDLYLALSMPSLVIGTVGGGTHLPDQRQCLQMLSCQGVGKVKRLAEIIAGFALALDISTMSAIAAGHFAIAHEKLGRNNHATDFKLGELDPAFFNHLLRQQSQAWYGPEWRVLQVQTLSDVSIGDSVVSELTSRRLKKAVGLFPFALRLENAQGQVEDIKLMVKIKPRAQEVSEIACNIAALCGEPLASEFARCRDLIGADTCDVKELAIFAQSDARFRAHTPHYFCSYQNQARGAYVLVQELLQDLELMDSAGDISGWQSCHLHAAIDGISACHAIWLGRISELQAQSWLGHYPNGQRALQKTELYRALLQHAEHEFPEMFCAATVALYRNLIDSIPDWWAEIEKMPRTLVHNDFNPRNLGFRRQAGQAPILCAYDWELATLHLPQRDIAELLCFVLPPEADENQVWALLEYQRHSLQQAANCTLDGQQWRLGFRYALYDFMLSTLLVYSMMHTFRHFSYLERVLASAANLCRILQQDLIAEKA